MNFFPIQPLRFLAFQKSLAQDVIKYLSDNNYKCTHVNSIKNAKLSLKNSNYNTVLLDLGLPDGDGLNLIKLIKEKDPSCGVIIISAKDALDKKVEGLELGADDYLTKPFFMPELNARIKSLIRRLNFEGNNEINAGVLKVIPEQMRLFVDGIGGDDCIRFFCKPEMLDTILSYFTPLLNIEDQR